MTTPPFEPVTPPGGSSTAGPQAAFCQSCGRPLTAEEIRRVGNAVFCEPCLIARVNSSSGHTGPMPPPPQPPVGGWPWQDPTMPRSQINPGLAALLGFIPGVGAMYNEQYAKGVAHLVIFAVLVSLSHITDFFGIVLGGWIIYMVIEAHHTARARRDGTPLPNPFGLNDIGERMGFGRSWPQGPPVAGVARDMADAFTSVAHDAFRPVGAPLTPTVPPSAANPAWGAPADQYPQQPAAAYGQPAYANVPYTQPPYAPPGYVPASTPFDPAFITPPIAPQPSRFPTGAAWLIGLGVLFLLGSTRIFSGLPNESLPGFVLFGFGVWLFVRSYTRAGNSALNGVAALDERNGPLLQIALGLRSSLMLLIIGALLLLAAFHIVSWSHSWPLIIIGAGALMLLTRTINSIRLSAMPMQPTAWPVGTPYPGNPYATPYTGDPYPASSPPATESAPAEPAIPATENISGEAH